METKVFSAFLLLYISIYLLVNWLYGRNKNKTLLSLGTLMILSFLPVFGSILLARGVYFYTVNNYKWQNEGDIAAGVLSFIGGVAIFFGLYFLYIYRKGKKLLKKK